jgi:hypothetical protein
VAEVVEYLLCKLKALSSNSSPIKKKKKKPMDAFIDACHLYPELISVVVGVEGGL